MGGGAACNITDVVDEILSQDANAVAVSLNWHMFGSNGHETADYSRGVLERFTRRSTDSPTVKPVCNPRAVDFLHNPHEPEYFIGYYSVKENFDSESTNGSAERIFINHYHCKSWEEYIEQHLKRGRVFWSEREYTREDFESNNGNDVFDDDILKYRDERAKVYQPPDNSHADERLFNALRENLSPVLIPTTPQSFYLGKMETFLTCCAVASYLKTKFGNDTAATFFEEAALVAILRSINGMSLADAQLFMRELPNLLPLPYPAVKELHAAALQVVSQTMDIMHMNLSWPYYNVLKYIRRLLEVLK